MNLPLNEYQRAVLIVSAKSLSCALNNVCAALHCDPLDIRLLLQEARKDAELAIEYLGRAAKANSQTEVKCARVDID